MLTAAQKAHFDTFGFIVLRGAFSPDEVEAITREFDALLARDPGDEPSREFWHHIVPFVERRPRLMWLIEDDRIYGTIEGLLGPKFIWAGSEGKITLHEEHHWHCDRKQVEDCDYTRIKVMLYLDPTTKERGALRVIPGSHRMPFFKDLQPLNAEQPDTSLSLYGVEGPDMPGYAVESQPGDVVFFNQALYHGVFNSWAGRRFIALKYAEVPTADAHFASLCRYSLTSGIFPPHEALLENRSPRMQRMVAPLVGITSRVEKLRGREKVSGYQS